MEGYRRGQARRQARTNSSVVELMVVFCLLIALGFPGSYTAVYGDRIGTLAEYAAFIMEIGLILATSSGNWQGIELIHLDRKYYILYLYVAFTFAQSMLVTYDRSAQMITCLRLIVTVLFVIWMQDRFSVSQILDMFCLAQGMFVLFTVLLMVRHPRVAYESTSNFTNALCGLYETKNACATELDFGIIISILAMEYKIKRRALPFWMAALFFVQCVLLLLCQATGALVTVVLVFIPVIMFKNRRFQLGLIYITVNILFLVCMLTMMPLFQDIFIAMGKDATLTGRIPMWNQIISIMMSHKTLMGFGYGMFWRDTSAVYLIQSAYSMRENPFMATLTTGAHNVVLEMWLNSGLLGIGAFFAALLYSFRDLKEMDGQTYRLCTAVMAYLAINGLTERCMGGNYDYKMVAVFLAMTLGCRYAPIRVRVVRQAKPDSENGGSPLPTGRRARQSKDEEGMIL